VLPKGFSKVRSYGLLSPACRDHLERARTLLESVAPKPVHPRTAAVDAADVASACADPADPRLCPICKVGRLVLVGSLPRSRAPP
jgi:hypothetical protein